MTVLINFDKDRNKTSWAAVSRRLCYTSKSSDYVFELLQTCWVYPD